jgi:phosphoribosylanthranilate isomerase
MTNIKICGITRLDDALAAIDAGADLLGFVLVESSLRHVAPSQAATIIAALKQRGIATPCVGVVADLSVARVRAIKQACGFTLMQLHGDENADTVAALYPEAIVARRVAGAASLTELASLRAFAYLLDAQGAKRQPGAAQAWDWRLLTSTHLPGRVIVAGGLRPDNVGAAVRQARPYGVDVSSGVEQAPGRKDWAAMASFIKTVREADNDDDPGE